jgi:uncharacterized membrane protein YfcA
MAPQLAAIGVTAGLASGLLGIGGGTIVTPLLSLISPLPQAAVLGTSLLAMLPPSAVALAQHYRQGLRSLLGSPGGPPLTPENWIPKL